MADIKTSGPSGLSYNYKDAGDGTNAFPVWVVGASGTGTPGGGSTATPVAYTDRSGTVTTGGSSQQLAAASGTRKGFFFQNISDADLFLNFGAAASGGSGSIKIPANAIYESPTNGVPSGTINVFGATTGKAFTAKEY